MYKESNRKSQFSPGQLFKAYQAATHFYLCRREDGSLPTQSEIAKELGCDPPRLSEYLSIAWKAGIIDVIVTPPAGVGHSNQVLREMELKLLKKLQPFSPPLIDATGRKLREHKLIQVHIVHGIDAVTFEPYSNDTNGSLTRDSVLEHVCRKAADEFFSLVKAEYEKRMNEGADHLYCGIGWSQTCWRVANLMRFSTNYFTKHLERRT